MKRKTVPGPNYFPVFLFFVVSCRTYVPEEVSTYTVEEFTVKRYQVPGYRCLRKGGVDPRELPKAAETPGDAAIFDVMYPAEKPGDKTPLVFMPHGNSLEFIEDIFTTSLKTLKVETDVRGYYEMFGTNPEQSTREGAEFMTGGTANAPIAIAMARAGAAVVIPGNCWGDGGHGTGQVLSDFFAGERLGGSFDSATWMYAQDLVAHSHDREVAVVCSGGGRRAIEVLHRQWYAFDAMVLDSPADDVTAFLDEPRPELLHLAGLALDDDALGKVFERFWTGIYGGKDKALKASLADELDRNVVSPPVFLAYSTLDPVVTAPVTRRLVEAMTRAEEKKPEKFTVRAYEQKVHCQLNNDQDIAAAVEWLNARVGGFRQVVLPESR